MKNKESKTQKKAPGFNIKGWRKLYVTAIQAHSGDFADAEPSGNLARIFVVLLLVHVFLIGSIVIYNIVSERPRIENALTATPSVKPKAAPVAPRPRQAVAVNQAPASMKTAAVSETYEVGSGDTIPSIAQKFGVDAEEMLRVNHLDDGGEIYPGRKLKIPAKTESQGVQKVVAQPANVAPHVESQPPAPSAPPAQAQAAKIEDSVPKATLVMAPPAAEATLDAPPAVESKHEKPAAAPVKERIVESKPTAKPLVKSAGPLRSYTTTSKDTFYSVARRFKVKVDDLMRLNGVSDPSKLHEGVKLKIPAPKE